MDKLPHRETVIAIQAMARMRRAHARNLRTDVEYQPDRRAYFERRAEVADLVAADLEALADKLARHRAYGTVRPLVPIYGSGLTPEERREVLHAIEGAPSVREDAQEVGDVTHRIRLAEYDDPSTGTRRWVVLHQDGSGMSAGDNPDREGAEYRYEELLGILKGGAS